MNPEIIVAIITGAVTIIVTIITVSAGIKKSAQVAAQEAAVRQAVTDTKLDELTREVRTHNDFARRVPVLEEQIKVANNRIADLEAKTK